MIEATTDEDVTIKLHLTMDPASARALMFMMQNPAQENESGTATEVRKAIFHALNKALT